MAQDQYLVFQCSDPTQGIRTLVWVNEIHSEQARLVCEHWKNVPFELLGYDQDTKVSERQNEGVQEPAIVPVRHKPSIDDLAPQSLIEQMCNTAGQQAQHPVIRSISQWLRDVYSTVSKPPEAMQPRDYALRSLLTSLAVFLGQEKLHEGCHLQEYLINMDQPTKTLPETLWMELRDALGKSFTRKPIPQDPDFEHVFQSYLRGKLSAGKCLVLTYPGPSGTSETAVLVDSLDSNQGLKVRQYWQPKKALIVGVNKNTKKRTAR
jgi:hypothetical protein